MVPLTADAVVHRALHRRTTANRGQRALIEALLFAVLGENVNRTVVDAVAAQCDHASVREVGLGGDKTCRDDEACDRSNRGNFAPGSGSGPSGRTENREMKVVIM